MVDQPTSRNRFRKQEVGTNVNSWGTNLNEALDAIDQTLDGVESIDLGGAASYTLTTTNYTTADEAKNRVLIFTNANAAGTNVIVPSVEHQYWVVNNGGAAVTPKTSAGTGIAIPDGARAAIYCDGTNVLNGAPTYMGARVQGVSTGTASTDATNLAQVSAAIAAAGTLTPATVRVSVNDTTAAFLSSKTSAKTNGGLKATITNPAGDEEYEWEMDATNLSVTSNVAAADRFALYDSTAGEMRYQLRSLVVGKMGLILQGSSSTVNPAVAGNLYPVDCTSGDGSFTGPASATVGDVIGVVKFGLNAMTFNPNGLNYYGSSSSFGVSPEGTTYLFYSGASRGWIDV